MTKISKGNISVEITGELGNQMFEVAAGYALARQNEVNLKLKFLDVPSRLDKFTLSEEIYEEIDANNAVRKKTRTKHYASREFLFNFVHANKHLLGIVKKMRKNSNKKIKEEDMKDRYHEKIPHFFDRKFGTLSSPVTIRGYFQSSKYFLDYSEEVKNLFVLKNPSEQLIDFEDRFKSDFTAIHIRRGNSGAAKLHKNFHGLLPIDYYVRATNLLKDLGALKRILVFTDNEIETRNFLRNFPYDYETIISSNDINDQSETLIAMSRSYSFIGANSSYSWWAAYLNKSDKLKAIFPATWYQEPGFPCQQMLEDKWIALPISDFHNE
jgi:hypothetical protein